MYILKFGPMTVTESNYIPHIISVHN